MDLSRISFATFFSLFPENVEQILDSTYVKNNEVQKKIVLFKNTLIKSNIKKGNLKSIKLYRKYNLD